MSRQQSTEDPLASSADPRLSDGSTTFFSMAHEELKSEESPLHPEKPEQHVEPMRADHEEHGASSCDAGNERERHASVEEKSSHTPEDRKSSSIADELQAGTQQCSLKLEEPSILHAMRKQSSNPGQVLETHRTAADDNEKEWEENKTGDKAREALNILSSRKAPAHKKRRLNIGKQVKRLFGKTSSSVKGAGEAISSKGRDVNRMWNFVLDQSIGLSSLFGLLSILFLAVAVVSCSWRKHEFKFEDRNGNNTISVHCGLQTVQRMHRLKRYNETGTLYLLDKARKYSDLIDSPFCMEDPRELDTSWLSLTPQKDEISDLEESSEGMHGRRLSAEDLAGLDPPSDIPETENLVNRAVEEDQSSTTNSTEPVTDELTDELPTPEEGNEQTGPDVLTSNATDVPQALQKNSVTLLPFQVVFGRDPAAAGNMTDNLARVRRALLGPVVYELNCRYLPDLKRAGEAFWSLVIPAFVFCSLGLLCGWLSTSWGKWVTGGNVPPTFALKLLGSLSWAVSLILLVGGLGAWGTLSDVAACVSSSGGTAVCELGASSIIALTSLAFNLLATVWFALHFTDRHITELKLSTQDQSQDHKDIGLPDLEGGNADERRVSHHTTEMDAPSIFVGQARETHPVSRSEEIFSEGGGQEKQKDDKLRTRKYLLP